MVIRAVATSDNHLSRFYDRLSPTKLRDRRAYLRQGFLAAVDDALAWSAHLFLICGDLFDTPDPRNLERAFVAREIARLVQAGITVCAIGGNHDTPRQSTEQGGVPPLDIYRALGAISYFDKSAQIESITRSIEGVTVAIGGLTPNPNWEPGFDPLSVLQWHYRAQGADTGILLLHGQVEGYTLPETDGALFARDSLRTATDADLILVGDIHRPKTIQLGNGRQVIIPGATERVTFGEADDVPGFMRLEYTPGTGWHAERVTLPGQPRADLLIRTSELPEDDIPGYLIARVRAEATPQTLVRVRLEGIISRDRYHALNLRRVQDELAAYVFQCVIETGALFLEETQTRTAQRGVRLSQQDEIAALAAEMLAATKNPQEQAIIKEAQQRLLGGYA